MRNQNKFMGAQKFAGWLAVVLIYAWNLDGQAQEDVCHKNLSRNEKALIFEGFFHRF